LDIHIILICLFSFFAGLVDSIAGGGGLIQTPAIMFLFPQYPIATLLGTTKIPSFSGTALAAYRYSRKIPINLRLFLFLFPAAFIGAGLGAWCITIVDESFIKPFILIVLVLIAIYSFFKKDFGILKTKNIKEKKQVLIGSIFGFVIGFYDGLIGPGTGSFFIICFVVFMGFDFITANANAKTLNLATNLSAIGIFAATNNILYHLAIPMALCNMAGAYIGSKLALLRGNRFIRVFFLLIIFATIIRFAYDVF